MSALIAWDLASKKSANALYNYIWWSEQSCEQEARFINIIKAILIFVNSLLNLKSGKSRQFLLNSRIKIIAA